MNVFNPNAQNYNPSAWQILRDLGINVIRIIDGAEGDIWRINIKNYPNEWAPNLNTFLNLADSNGIKVYFYELGTPWNTLFGIRGPSTGSPLPINEAKAMIDQLAGNNSLHHNFITDPRIWIWSVDNEPDISNSVNLNWEIQISDYIRGKGGATVLAGPRGQGGWGAGEDFHVTEPLLRDHFDYLEMHKYGIWELRNWFTNNGTINWTGWYTWLRDILLNNMVGGRGSFPVGNLILGEFGIWRGIGSDSGLVDALFTDEDRQNYYTYYFKALGDVGLQNVNFHYSFQESDYGHPQPEWGIVNSQGSYNPYVAEVIRNAYSIS